LDGDTGKRKWGHRLAYLSAIAIGRGGELYVTTQNFVFSLDGRTGFTNWVSGFFSQLYGQPSIGPDGTLFLPVGETLYAIDGASGKTKWQNAECCWRSPVIGAAKRVYPTHRVYQRGVQPA
jgi:outer membrane protein assembly factor BamB